MNKTKGTIKRAVGALIGNKKLERAGKRDQLKGQAQATIEDAKTAAKEIKQAIKVAVKGEPT